MNNRTAASVMLVLVGLLGGFLTWNEAGTPWAAGQVCDVASIRTLADQAHARGQEDVRRYRLEEIDACNDTDAKTKASSSATPTTSLTPDESASPTAAATPAADATSGTDSASKLKKTEFYANRPVAEKLNKVNNFGPNVAQDPALNSRELESLTADQAVQEFGYRLKRDAMLTASTGAMFGFWGVDQIDAKTQFFKSNMVAHQKTAQRVIDTLSKSKNAVYSYKSGTYASLYALPGQPPLVRSDTSVSLPQGFVGLNVTLPSGKSVTFKLACGFQPTWVPPAPAVKPLPPPSPGICREDGSPKKCEPKETPKPSPTPTPKKSPKPSATPTPSTPPTATPTPCHPNGDGSWSCPKTAAPQPSGVESPTDNPVGSPTSSPTAKATPLTPQPSGQPTTPSDGHTAAQPDEGGQTPGQVQTGAPNGG